MTTTKVDEERIYVVRPLGVRLESPKGQSQLRDIGISTLVWEEDEDDIRGPGGPPRPAKPGGNPAGGAGPPTPMGGPVSPIGRPRPAGLLMPGPATRVGGAPPDAPGTPVPSRAEGSAAGGASTDKEMIWVPRTMVNPNVRFSSVSTMGGGGALPGAD